MNLADAEAKLDDYLMKGIVSEIFWADECRAFAVKIGKHSAELNKTQYAQLFGRLQTIMSEHQTMAVAKIYDRDRRTRSIPSIISLIEDNVSVWHLKDRRALETFLIREGRNETLIKNTSDADLILYTTGHYRRTLPHPANAPHCNLSVALKGVLESRNKVHAHNEAIDAAMRTRPTWGGTENLVDYAKNFVSVIGMAFFARWFGTGSDDYYLSRDAQRISQMFERMMKDANLISIEHRIG